MLSADQDNVINLALKYIGPQRIKGCGYHKLEQFIRQSSDTRKWFDTIDHSTIAHPKWWVLYYLLELEIDFLCTMQIQPAKSDLQEYAYEIFKNPMTTFKEGKAVEDIGKQVVRMHKSVPVTGDNALLTLIESFEYGRTCLLKMAIVKHNLEFDQKHYGNRFENAKYTWHNVRTMKEGGPGQTTHQALYSNNIRLMIQCAKVILQQNDVDMKEMVYTELQNPDSEKLVEFFAKYFMLAPNISPQRLQLENRTQDHALEILRNVMPGVTREQDQGKGNTDKTKLNQVAQNFLDMQKHMSLQKIVCSMFNSPSECLQLKTHCFFTSQLREDQFSEANTYKWLPVSRSAQQSEAADEVYAAMFHERLNTTKLVVQVLTEQLAADVLLSHLRMKEICVRTDPTVVADGWMVRIPYMLARRGHFITAQMASNKWKSGNGFLAKNMWLDFQYVLTDPPCTVSWALCTRATIMKRRFSEILGPLALPPANVIRDRQKYEYIVRQLAREYSYNENFTNILLANSQHRYPSVKTTYLMRQAQDQLFFMLFARNCVNANPSALNSALDQCLQVLIWELQQLK